MLSAEIIAIGSELLTPEKSDTNSVWLTERLNEIGIEVKMKIIVGDDAARLEKCISDAVSRSDIVLMTGGLGPTTDDITRECAAKALGRELEYHDDIEQHLRERFRSWGREMPEINKRQAFVVTGAEILPNPNGSACGMLIVENGKYLAILPGPPKENQPMFLNHVLQHLDKLTGDVYVRRRVVKVSGKGESAVDEVAAPIYSKFSDITTSILFNKSEVEIHLAARADSAKEADKVAAEAAEEIAAALGTAVFSTNGESMEAVVGRMLAERGETVATAESCTGGLIAERLTDIPGSSAYFMAGVVTYSNEAKIRDLGVPAEIIEKHGAVSAECAEAMAAGMLERGKTTYAVSVTGIAGPDGGSDEKPVGTVFLGIADAHGVRSKRFQIPGDRYLIRWRTSQAALDILRRRILHKDAAAESASKG
jgi:nicotinamide-nucleotide amidase